MASRRLLVLAIIACVSGATVANAASPQTFTETAVVAILGPKEGLTPTKYGVIEVLAQEIIKSLLPVAERNAIQQMGLNTNDDFSLKVNPVPESLLFELHATGPSSKSAADFANSVACQLEKGLPNADPVAVQQLERELGNGPILLLLEPAKPDCITEVRLVGR